MKLSQVTPFIGLPYCPKTFDCADLVVKVQAELFGRDIVLPSRRPRGRIGQARLGELSRAYVTETDAPQDGDLVLMSEFPNKKFSHVGVYFFLANEPYILHAQDELVGSITTRVRDLASARLRIEGYYSWITTNPASS
ncbi:hypothetical protein 20Sep420_00109 [Pseudomonas phage 20Sep420]|nr:hypothetical protein 20Sep420_00109 [Pseudomonas phage 20Sep420]